MGTGYHIRCSYSSYPVVDSYTLRGGLNAIEPRWYSTVTSASMYLRSGCIQL